MHDLSPSLRRNLDGAVQRNWYPDTTQKDYSCSQDSWRRCIIPGLEYFFSRGLRPCGKAVRSEAKVAAANLLCENELIPENELSKSARCMHEAPL
jgi:hypothetical protein